MKNKKVLNLFFHTPTELQSLSTRTLEDTNDSIDTEESFFFLSEGKTTQVGIHVKY